MPTGQATYNTIGSTLPTLSGLSSVVVDSSSNGICLFASVQTVADKVRGLHAMGIRHVATKHNFGALDPELVERSMRLFARKVMPRVSGTSTRARTSGSARSSSGAAR